VAKRSPILGYNHNVRYRGLIFHVQTEDSGLLSPHLYTHLFYGGVILSTRKLVYDAGAAEDAIKGLMQAQHKVVLKDLKAGKFDDKIDQYLAGTEGLLPRTTPAASPAAASPAATSPAADAGPPVPPEPPVESDAAHEEPSEPEISIVPESQVDLSSQVTAPVATPVATPVAPSSVVPVDDAPPQVSRTATPPLGSSPRTRTAERKSAPTQVRTNLPSEALPLELAPTLADASAAVAAAVAAANATVKTEILDEDSTPEIQILPGEDDSSPRTRMPRDTEIQEVRSPSMSDGVPGPIGAPVSGRMTPDSIPAIPAIPERRTGDRGSAVGAAALPPARPITRPPSRQIPTVMSRPITQDDARKDDAVEVYAPAPPTGDPLPVGSERPGQYAQHKRVPLRPAIEVVRERPGTGSPTPTQVAGRSRRPRPRSAACARPTLRTSSPRARRRRRRRRWGAARAAPRRRACPRRRARSLGAPRRAAAVS
jgi:hypothetical protein